jgi:hypothetical protein
LRGSGAVLHRCVLKSLSTDKGRTWSDAEAINVPNPNTKFHVIRVNGGIVGKPAMALVYNNHKRTQARNYATRTLFMYHLPARFGIAQSVQ